MRTQTSWMGLLLAITGGIFWGASGTVAELMFRTEQVTALWVVGVRLICAGLLLLLSYRVMNRAPIGQIWRDRTDRNTLLRFSFLGMLPSQLCYFLAIQYGNAATATVLQFTGPVFIIIYFAVVNRRWPVKLDAVAILIAVAGTFLLATKGHLDSLSISLLGLLFGLAAGAANASYTVIPVQLLQKYDPKLVCGWAMLLGSIPLLPVVMLDMRRVQFTGALWLELLFIILIGTMLAYLFYVASLRSLKPAVTGALGSFEPLTATLLSVVFLHLILNGAEIIGGGLILLMALLQSIAVQHNG